ncbi:hypothetical protein [Halocatena pleomorpha]|uniref:Uncharacterized protein n=1 Tax=Halocatena pleomorpha TaxID=1785090 RepID=A0A3P3REV5_9EURY|nr:hypothetical protein [Halocatena pleomorpha]RRJ31459.1 hypothetical protein EIK79_07015 [Halocatena pleomorpha]
MNRRHRAVIAVLIAVPLFVTPLVSPVPNYDAHIEMGVHQEPVNQSASETGQQQVGDAPTVRYQNLSAPGQRLFDSGYNDTVWSGILMEDAPTVPLDEAPEPWATLVPTRSKGATTVYVHRDGHYYETVLHRFTPKPSLPAFGLRLGSLLGAIGFGTLAGYFGLASED